MNFLNGIPIYETDAEIQSLCRATIDFGGVMGAGFDPESLGGFGSACEPIQYASVPRSEWKDRIEDKKAKGLFPSAWFDRGKVEILNQQNWGYCWMYGIVGAMQCRYAMSGQQAPHLNAFYPAWLGKNGRNEGGWGGEALQYIERFGVPEYAAFPGKPTQRSAFDRPEVKHSAERHKVWKFRELPRNSFQSLMDMFLSDHPLPVSQAYNWWRHLVYAIEPVATGRDSFGILIANSWGLGYGRNGLAIIAENRAVAAEQITVDMVSTIAA